MLGEAAAGAGEALDADVNVRPSLGETASGAHGEPALGGRAGVGTEWHLAAAHAHPQRQLVAAELRAERPVDGVERVGGAAPRSQPAGLTRGEPALPSPRSEEHTSE